jgi:hypothetical protein
VSIISDALKRAHLETVSRDRPQRWAHRTPGTVDYPEQRSWRGRFPAVLVVVNVVLVLLIGGAVYLRGGIATWSWTSQRPGEAKAAAVPAESHLTPAHPVVEKKEIALPPAAPETSPISSEAVSAPVRNHDREMRQAPLIRQQASARVVATPPHKIAPPAEVAPRMRDGLVDGRTYVETVPLPDGNKLTLYGLTKAGGRGAALINGKVAWEGERIGDFVVERVERSRVQLRYGDIKLFLTLP